MNPQPASESAPSEPARVAQFDEKTIARFWSKVDKNGPVPPHCPELGKCWLWTASTLRSGYGQLQIGTLRKPKNLRAHRAAFIIENGWSPMVVMHLCDNPACVNAAHLKAGSQIENIQDAVVKGRLVAPSLKGEMHPGHKLTSAQVLEARAMYNHQHGDITRIAREFKISLSQAHRIVRRDSWKSIM